MKKEARALLWPWCGVVAAGAMPLLFPHSGKAAELNYLSFFFGIPLLATLALGNEFHHRTVSLWLTQPASRMQLWGEKMSVMCAAVLSAALFSGTIMFLISLPELEMTYNKAVAVAYVLITLASATYWTLAARSTVGGFVLIAWIFWAFYMFGDAAEKLPVASRGLEAVATSAATTIAILAFAVSFSSLMLWLGVRKLARYQVTGAASGEDLLMSGPSVMPEAFAGWFRSRSSGSSLNLIRKELRLLRPLWVIEVLTLAYVACLGMFRLLPVPPVGFPHSVAQWAILGPIAMSCMGMAGLAGFLSLGEERRSGTHAWDMILPVSSRRQWLVKFIVAMVAGLACSLLLPFLTMIAAGAFYGSPFLYVHIGALRDELIAYPILTFACFWCACAANGSVRAAIWAMPVTAAIPLASYSGILLGREMARNTGALKDLAISALHLSPFAFSGITAYAREHILWLFFPAFAVGLFQSFRLFRAQPRDGTVWMLRCLAPLAAVTILWSLLVTAGFTSSSWQPFEETQRALERLEPGSASVNVGAAKLVNASSISALTERWLKGSTMSVTPGDSQSVRYRATIHLASGRECRLTVTRFGGSAASCGQTGP
jgi:ABC-type transport system involved in multi-copper enzyme maturation permease subunit